MDIKVFEALGLSNIEAKVYLSLLELGNAVANKVAEKSGIHRRTVYDALETLIEKGLVSFVIEANKKYSIEFNTSSLNKGIYFLKLKTTTEQKVKKLIIIK